MALDNTWLESDDWMQMRTPDDSDDEIQELTPLVIKRERPLPSSFQYVDTPTGKTESFSLSQVTYALRERFLVDINQLPLDVIQDYFIQWRREVDYQNKQRQDQRDLPIMTANLQPTTTTDDDKKEEHDPPVPLPRLIHSEDVLEDLWARHIPDKNEYVEGSEGRRIVRRRVFQRRDAPEWAWDCCHYCLSRGAVCRDHQFELRGNDGVDRYVKEVVRTGWFRHAWYAPRTRCIVVVSSLCRLPTRRQAHRTGVSVYYNPPLKSRFPRVTIGQPLLPRGILTDYLASFQRLTPPNEDWLRRAEVAARADIVDACRDDFRSIWRLHRLTRACLDSVPLRR